MKKIIIACCIFLLTGCGSEKQTENDANNNSDTNNTGGIVYYEKTNYNTNSTDVIKVDVSSLDKETVLSGTDYFGGIQVVGDKIFGLISNRVVYVKDGKANYITSEDEYVARYYATNDNIYYGKDNNNGSDNIFEHFAMKKIDGTGLNDIHEQGISQLIVDDAIYFKPNSGSEVTKLLKYDLDGSNKRVLYEKSIGYLIKSGDYLYFINYDDNKSIYQLKTDGTDEKKLAEGPFTFSNVTYNQINGNYSLATLDNVLYYINSQDSDKLYKIENETSSKISDDSFQSIKIVGGNIFAIYKGYTKPGIYMLDKDGEEIKQITSDMVNEFDVK